MKTEIEQTPEKALQKNAAQITRISIEYGLGSLAQLAACHHRQDTACAECQRSSENLHYFSVALAAVAAAAKENKTAELYDILTKFAAENFEGFPKDLHQKGLYKLDSEFPSEIEEWK